MQDGADGAESVVDENLDLIRDMFTGLNVTPSTEYKINAVCTQADWHYANIAGNDSGSDQSLVARMNACSDSILAVTASMPKPHSLL